MKKNVKKLPSLYGSRFYRIWGVMMRRCYDRKLQSYPNYGGRGIKVCKEWHEFANFRRDEYAYYLLHADDFGEKATTIDRINGNGDYSPENVAWSDWITQANHRRPKSRKPKQLNLFKK